MSKITGKVSKVDERETAYGFSMYNIVVGNTTVGVGKFPPKVEVGDYVELEAEQKGRYWNMVPRSLRKIAEPENETPAVLAKPAAATGTYNRFDPAVEARRQESITKQASRNAAIAFMGILAGQDALPVAKSAKPGDKLEALGAICDKITENFYEYAAGITRNSATKDSTEDGDNPEENETWG